VSSALGDLEPATASQARLTTTVSVGDSSVATSTASISVGSAGQQVGIGADGSPGASVSAQVSPPVSTAKVTVAAAVGGLP
jgi:hypothetical protein